MKLKTKKSIN